MKSIVKYLVVLPFLFSRIAASGVPMYEDLFVFAGNDTIVCFYTDSIQVNGYAENYHYVAWSHTGDGFFYNATSLKTAYVPGPQDLIKKNVTLFLVGISNQPWYSILVDSLQVSIVMPPNSYAGMDATICEGLPFRLNGVVCQCEDFYWQTSGDGTFDNVGQLNPLYTHGPADLINGVVNLTITAFPNSPCTQPHSDEMKLFISAAPYLEAGSESLICQGDIFNPDVQAENFSNIYWATTGDGTFCINTIVNPEYFPGSNDYMNGFVRLFVLITPNDACGLYLVDSIDLTIQKGASVQTGPDRSICETEILECIALAENYESIHWMTFGGNGYFENQNAPITNYHLGDHEKATGIFYVNVIAMPLEPCQLPVSSFFSVDVLGLPSVDAGSDMNLCSHEPLLVEGFGYNFETLVWQTSGDGTFENENNSQTIYYPGVADVMQASFKLFVLASGYLPCSLAAIDSISVFNGLIQDFQSEMEDMELFSGNDLALSFEVESPGTGAYQWYFDHMPIENQINPQLILNDVSPQNAGYYYCIYENCCFQISSDTALLEIFVQGQQEIALTQGWNGVSSYIIPINNTMETVLSPVIDEIVILFSEDGIYSPYMDLMTIFEWKPQKGYITKINVSDTLVITGYLKYPSQPLIITSGWSLFSTGCWCEVNTEDYFSSYPSINIIKEIGGMGVYWPEKGINTLDKLKPGKAYHVFNASLDGLLIAFPGCDD